MTLTSTIDEQRFLARGRMGPNERVRMLDWLSPDDTAARFAELGLFETGVNGCQTMEALLQSWR